MEYIWVYLIAKCRHTNKTSGKDITGLHGASLKFYVLNMANSNSLFTHCLRKGKKKGVTNFVTPWFWKWTSLGLNQGPPDYESVALTNWATSPVYPFTGCGDKSSIFYWNMQVLTIKNYNTFSSQNLYLRFGFLGNQPFFPRSSCSKTSLMVQNEEKANTPNREDRMTLSTLNDAATPAMPSIRNIHQHLVPQ